MHNLLPIFSALCGENPKHIWSPGGQLLPCCQRCTGLYVGALMAVILQLWIRPRTTKRFLQIHALFLLQLGLFVFPWFPQSAVLRTISGILFGFGAVAFLWPAVVWCPPFRVSDSHKPYALNLVLSVLLIPTLAQIGGTIGAYILICMIVAGALSLAILSGLNLARLIFGREYSIQQSLTDVESQRP